MFIIPEDFARFIIELLFFVCESVVKGCFFINLRNRKMYAYTV